ncbi:MAG: hypothetical protein LQ342_001200 [Letrouitia transgressa]|nr:MAG: hypothetical protein LQ342_001200 [Letrouitia transgressa]
MVNMDSLAPDTLSELRTVYDIVIPVDRIVNKSPANLYLMQRPGLNSTFTKIALWRQTQYQKIVYLDADTVILRAPDELFDEPTDFAAVPDIGWPDCFNSGVLVLKPDMGHYYGLLALAQRGISFDGADQGLLNMHFQDWHRLSFKYNCTPNGNYQYVPAYRHFQSSISLIHFIGNDKPWLIGRESKVPTGVYEEMMGRWWAVYDRHFRAPTTAYISGQSQPGPRTVQRHVNGEASTSSFGFSSIIERSTREDLVVSVDNIEEPMTDNAEMIERVEQGDVQPIPTTQQRRHSVVWDPIRSAPPANSRPEAPNIPGTKYEMSQDSKLFQAPSSYPEPPKDMYYQVPETAPASEPLKPIFPWEINMVKPVRVFPEDQRPSSSGSAPSATTDEETQAETNTPVTPTINVISPAPFSSFSRTNVWDAMPEIERYVANLPQHRRAKIQVLHGPTTGTQTILSPGTEEPPSEAQGRRRSMKLTDFPTEIERPSLPVTPAPIHRPKFWGEERNESGDLPPAEGVPDQSDWDPLTRLAELQRRQSEVLATGPGSPGRFIPDRSMPDSAVLLPVVEDKDIAPIAPPELRETVVGEISPEEEAITEADDAPADEP